ncbi:MAG: hypothetical protein K8L97_16820 [Anaerolineae bacterium]|nr:hypothetical protein [Anaerolineae bacterium]
MLSCDGGGAVAKKGFAANKPLACSHQPLVNTDAFASLLCRRCRGNDNRLRGNVVKVVNVKTVISRWSVVKIGCQLRVASFQKKTA